MTSIWDSGELVDLDEVMISINDNEINSCKEKLYSLATKWDDYSEESILLKEEYFKAQTEVWEYYYSYQIENSKYFGNEHDFYSDFLGFSTDYSPQPVGTSIKGNISIKIAKEFNTTVPSIGNQSDELTEIQVKYVVLNYYKNKSGSNYVKLFCYFY